MIHGDTVKGLIVADRRDLGFGEINEQKGSQARQGETNWKVEVRPGLASSGDGAGIYSEAMESHRQGFRRRS